MNHSWLEIIERANFTEPLIQRSLGNSNHLGLKMFDRDVPVSLSEREFNFIGTYCEEHSIQTAFDLATGFGISALCLGLAGVKQVISLDSFSEETLGIQPIKGNLGVLNERSRGYYVAHKLISIFNIEDRVSLNVGWAPQSFPDILRPRSLDLVFLDCPKTTEDLSEHLTNILPYLSDKWSIFIHDTHSMTNPGEAVETILGRKMISVLPQVYPLMLVSNL